MEQKAGNQPRRSHSLCRIVNSRLLPLKIHFYLSVGALAGVMPYIVLHAETLGISPGLSGVTNAIMLISSAFLKCFIGASADKFKAVKSILVMVQNSNYYSWLQAVLFQALFHIVLYTCIPPIDDVRQWEQPKTGANVLYSDNFDYRTICSCNRSRTITCSQTFINATTLSDCGAIETHYNQYHCIVEQRQRRPSAVRSWQFWAFFVLRICSGALAAVVFSISDAATYAILGNEKDLYGKQRLWGTMAMGTLSPIIGFLNEYYSSEQRVDYGPGFYSNVVISLLDLVAIYFLDIPQMFPSSQTITKDLKVLFRSKHVLFFILGVFVQGTLMGPIWSYAFFYFKLLGASQSLLGLQMPVQSFLSEVPVMFFAGWITSKLGFKDSITLAVGATVIRLVLYAVGTNPWMMLPIEMLHGLSFGLFYSAMTMYANRIAPKGAEATVQSIVSGVFEGAGIAVGSVVCGVLFDIDPRRTMLYFSAYGFVFLIIQVVVNYLLGDAPMIEGKANKASNNTQEEFSYPKPIDVRMRLEIRNDIVR